MTAARKWPAQSWCRRIRIQRAGLRRALLAKCREIGCRVYIGSLKLPTDPLGRLTRGTHGIRVPVVELRPTRGFDLVRNDGPQTRSRTDSDSSLRGRSQSNRFK